MFKSIALGLVVLIVGLLGFAATRPDSFSVQRQITIKAPAEKIYPLVNDFHQWTAWSPWEKLDSTMTRTHSGAPAGKGAVYGWKGNKDVGSGRMEITDSTAPSQVQIKLDFFDPFEAQNRTTFSFQPQADGSTQVVWVMQGPMNYVSKLMSVFVSMDKMIGKDFETGLANMKAAAEK
ncbi:SRPBCC family protein [Roseateles toxinivorans]|uniref:Polyketide cyclase/dehydrase/lipid transport protein n=1 Tax=Roseateles toxinivorans TaxID=270368 RepID=A0A4R6QUS6_9BURK|nr:SRPBCC family protein [Roseateles toxinivorans]TDP74792.1 polyketide cyclase/dehydrase/lipid transport protein [Roseateles toxinivorans]